MRQQIREAVAEATRRGKLRPNSVDSITGKNSGNNLGPGTPDHPLRAVGARRDRGQADPQGRRLREHEHQYARAVRAGRTSAAPTARSRACASASCTRCGRRRARAAPGRRRRLHRRRPRRRATCTPRQQLFRTLDDVQSRSGAWPSSKRRSWRPSTRSASGTMGFGGKHVADRLQDRRAQPAAGELLRVGGLRLLGVPPPRRACSTRRTARSRSGSIAIRAAPGRCR